MTPIYTFILLIFIFGQDLQDLKIGIVNEDNCYCYKLHKNRTISCNFEDLIPKNKLKLITYNTIEEASEASKSAKIVGFIHIPKNFSNEFLNLRTYYDITICSQIGIYLDTSDIYKDNFSKGVLFKAYEKFIQNMTNAYGVNYNVYRNTMMIKNYEKEEEIGEELTIAKSVVPSMYSL